MKGEEVNEGRKMPVAQPIWGRKKCTHKHKFQMHICEHTHADTLPASDMAEI